MKQLAMLVPINCDSLFCDDSFAHWEIGIINIPLQLSNNA